MLREAERTFPRAEHETRIRTDVIVVGSGILGLLVAKKLGDLGQSVVLLESSSTLADGASVKNHGWLHRGSAHAVSVKDPKQAKRVVQKLTYGHEYLRSYAPESLEDPFEPVFTLTQDPETAQRAVKIWSSLGVWFEEIPREKFWEEDTGIRRDIPYFIFQSADLRINNRILLQRLASDIKDRGNLIIKNASFDYEDFEKIRVRVEGRDLRFAADIFVYCAGVATGNLFSRLSGKELDISFWKSHLILLPRFSPFSLVSLDKDLPIIINHKETSIVNRAYDEFPINNPDNSIVDEEVEAAFQSLVHLYPKVCPLRSQVEVTACCKPSISASGQTRHSVDSQIFEPVPNHYFVLPGKMTEAPYVSDELIQHIYCKLDFDDITPRPVDRFNAGIKSLSKL